MNIRITDTIVFQDILNLLDSPDKVHGSDNDAVSGIRKHVQNAVIAENPFSYSNYNTALKASCVLIFQDIKNESGSIKKSELNLLKWIMDTLINPNEMVFEEEVDYDY